MDNTIAKGSSRQSKSIYHLPYLESQMKEYEFHMKIHFSGVTANSHRGWAPA